MRVLLIDNYDSFTYNLYDYLIQLKAECLVKRNDEITLQEIEAEKFDAIVLSPGPQTPYEAGLTFPVIEKFYQEIPILGICLGHQALGLFFGGKLTKASVPVHGKTSPIIHNTHPLFNNLPNTFEVMRYHSLIVKELDESAYQPIAYTPEKEIMAAAHETLPLAGVQFHPESILTEYGLKLLENWMAWIQR